MIGYFPTYALGNMYAAQFFDCAMHSLPDLAGAFARGEFGSLKTWLNAQIHRHGRRYRAQKLVEQVTKQSLSPTPLVRHLHAKFDELYGL